MRYTQEVSKRLQVVMDDIEYADVEAAARRQGATVSQWVRQTLQEARLRQPKADSARKLAVLRDALGHDFPTGDIEQILAETERGYLS